MRGLIPLSLVLPAFVTGVGAGVLALWPIGAAEPAAFPVGDAARGAYLARGSGCISCHTNTAAAAPALAGGAPLDTLFGTFVPPNITPHPDLGIGRWTIQDFARAVRQGVSPEGKPYYPVFTYSFYAGFPFGFRPGLKLWRAAYLYAPETYALMGAPSPWNRGGLLVEGAACCAACHTGRNLAGGLTERERFGGNDRLSGGGKAPPILAADLIARGWTVANRAYALKSGLLPIGDAFGGSMAEVVAQGASFLTDADREAIATYPLDPGGTGVVPPPVEPSGGIPMSANMDHSQMDMANEN
ncbi:MAG TPA: cytochrome c [Albidovulum sp.]|uniref:c-type cytochrome n=1 Tax=Albidovulum sp. TaxID=1872424 RepID=UPI002CF4B6DA|nr:cytochrome c [Albidovulum sp.]